jgi:hypothetical protein
MSAATDNHPKAVLKALLDKGFRSHRRERLLKIHELCRKQHEAGSRDFSLPTIGDLAEKEDIMVGRALYNANSDCYKELIEAWAVYAGPPDPKPPKTLASHEFLMRIADPAMRSIVQRAIVERNRFQAELNMLKAKTIFDVDKRPEGDKASVVAPYPQLTESEREALRRAISPDYLKRLGMYEGGRGEILYNHSGMHEKGEKVFEIRFAQAIRKVLGATGPVAGSSQRPPEYDGDLDETITIESKLSPGKVKYVRP